MTEPAIADGRRTVPNTAAVDVVVSADSHLEVAPSAWCQDSAVDEAAELFDRTPVLERLSRSHLGGLIRANPLRRRPAADPSEGTDPERRLVDMTVDGVHVEILYPSHAFDAVASLPAPAGLAAHLAGCYNDWVSGFCATNPARLAGLAVIPSCGLPKAIEELTRAADLPGIVGVCLQQWPNGTGRPQPQDEEFWRAALDLDVPVTFHIGMGAGLLGTRLDPSPDLAYLVAPFGGHTEFTITQLIVSGVFDRHPALRVAVGECGLGWLPFYAEQADLNHRRYQWTRAAGLTRPPSAYLTENLLFGFQEDRSGLRALTCLPGEWVDCLTWGSDYPHTVSDWPASRALLDRQLQELPTGATARITGGNASRFYRLGLLEAEGRP